MSNQSRVSTSASVLALLIVAAGIPALASGFQLREQGASGQGQSYAGVSAGGSDISSMFYNPASLTLFGGTQLQLGFTNILPTTKFSDGVASRSALPSSFPYSAISGPASHGNAAKSAVTPTLYAMWSFSKDLKAGIAINVPYGLTTEYDPNWIGRYHALRSHLETVDIAPTIAYRFNEQWSGGISFVARQAKAELSQGADLGYSAFGAVSAMKNPVLVNVHPVTHEIIVHPGAADGSVFVKGDAWSYGFKAGLIYQPTKTLRLGLGYQSSMTSKVKGDATFTVPSTAAAGLAGLAQLNAGAQAQAEIAYLGAAFAAATANGPVSAEVPLPALLSLGVNYDVSPTFTLSAELQRTQWSKFKELRLKFSNPATQPDSTTAENWSDTTFVSVGASCHPGDGWTYRLGLAMDKAPMEDAYRTPRIPDADRTWASAGASYQFSKAFGLDFGYSHIIAKDSTVKLLGGTDSTSSDFGKGNLSGTYKNAIDIWALQARWSF